MENETILEMMIDDIAIGKMSESGYIPLRLGTNRGTVDCRYYHGLLKKRGIILVGGIEGGFDSPAQNLYPRLSHTLVNQGNSVLRIQFRYPTDLIECALDILAGITFLERFGVEEIGIVGHSSGAAAAIQAAAAAPDIVRTVVTLASQIMGIEAISHISHIPLLLVHGTDDQVLPAYTSTYIHDLAQGQKELLLFEGGSHELHEVADEVYDAVSTWLNEKMM